MDDSVDRFDAAIEMMEASASARHRNKPALAITAIAIGTILLVGSYLLMNWFLGGGPTWALFAIMIGPVGAAGILYGLRQLARVR